MIEKQTELYQTLYFKQPCPYCGGKVELRTKQSLSMIPDETSMMWVCTNYPACNTYIETKPGTNEPRGTLANQILRKKRRDAHGCYDLLYLTQIMTRKESYVWLAERLGKTEETTHIAQMDEHECEKVMEYSRELLFRNFGKDYKSLLAITKSRTLQYIDSKKGNRINAPSIGCQTDWLLQYNYPDAQLREARRNALACILMLKQAGVFQDDTIHYWLRGVLNISSSVDLMSIEECETITSQAFAIARCFGKPIDPETTLQKIKDSNMKIAREEISKHVRTAYSNRYYGKRYGSC